MTPRTRSLYAYVGESHQPYQSPSKDLDMINGRISGRLPHVMGVQVCVLSSTCQHLLVFGTCMVHSTVCAD